MRILAALVFIACAGCANTNTPHGATTWTLSREYVSDVTSGISRLGPFLDDLAKQQEALEGLMQIHDRLEIGWPSEDNHTSYKLLYMVLAMSDYRPAGDFLGAIEPSDPDLHESWASWMKIFTHADNWRRPPKGNRVLRRFSLLVFPANAVFGASIQAARRCDEGQLTALQISAGPLRPQRVSD